MANWKANINSNQPIVAVEDEPGRWVIFGGTYRLKQSMAARFDSEFPAPHDFNVSSNVYMGEELPESMKRYIDFIFPNSVVSNEEGGKSKGSSGKQLPGLRHWKKHEIEASSLYTMFYEDPQEVSDFIKPSYWEDLIYYLRFPEVYPAIALVGPTGNGKTTTAVKAQEALGVQYVVIDMNEFITPEELIGGFSYDPEKGRVWVDGTVTYAFRNGMNIIINEFDAANPRAVMCLQSVLQDPGTQGVGRYVTIPGSEEDRVYPQGPCTVIVTMNTYGTGATRSYVGRNAADAATMDRFAFISTIYENEDKILVARGFKARTAKALIDWATNKRKIIDENALKLNISPRVLMRMAHLIEARDMTLPQAAESQFLSRVAVEDRELLA